MDTVFNTLGELYVTNGWQEVMVTLDRGLRRYIDDWGVFPTGRVLVAVDTLAWPSAMHRSWKPPNEPHLHLKGAPITLAAFYFIDVAREPRGCTPP